MVTHHGRHDAPTVNASLMSIARDGGLTTKTLEGTPLLQLVEGGDTDTWSDHERLVALKLLIERAVSDIDNERHRRFLHVALMLDGFEQYLREDLLKRFGRRNLTLTTRIAIVGLTQDQFDTSKARVKLDRTFIRDEYRKKYRFVWDRAHNNLSQGINAHILKNQRSGWPRPSQEEMDRQLEQAEQAELLDSTAASEVSLRIIGKHPLSKRDANILMVALGAIAEINAASPELLDSQEYVEFRAKPIDERIAEYVSTTILPKDLENPPHFASSEPRLNNLSRILPSNNLPPGNFVMLSTDPREDGATPAQRVPHCLSANAVAIDTPESRVFEEWVQVHGHFFPAGDHLYAFYTHRIRAMNTGGSVNWMHYIGEHL
jgi:hypothetical protein